jgi:hypothetical protein
MVIYEGGCHCGRIAFTVEGEIDSLYECNCSICSKRGALHWFVGASQFALKTPDENAATYLFNKRAIRHRFCPQCGVAPYGQGEKPGAGPMVAVNARCLEAVDLKQFAVVAVDGRRF